MRTCLIFTTSFLLAIFIGCSGGANQPTVPASDEMMPAQQAGDVQILMSGTMNLDDGTVEFNNRNGEYYLNVTPYVGSYFSWEIIYSDPPYLTLEMTLTNPTNLTLYDVCIVFDELYGKTVRNPDLYTDIFEPYDINPAIEFRKESDTRTFPPMEDTELFGLIYTGGSPMVDFFIIAHLGGNTGGVRDFGFCKSYGWFFPDGGTKVTLLASVHDYQDDVSYVVADTSVFTGELEYFTNPSLPHWWEAEIENALGAPAGVYNILTMAHSPSVPHYNTYNYTKVYVYNPGDDPTWFGANIYIEGDDEFANTNINSSGGHAIDYDNDFFYLAFASDDNANEGAIYFTRSEDGDIWINAKPLTEENNGLIESYPSLVSHKGCVFVVYQAERGHDTDIRLLASYNNGNAWTAYKITETPMKNEITPSICMDTSTGEERIYVAYIDADTGECIVAGADLDNLSNWKTGIVSDGGWPHDAELPSIAFNHTTHKVMVCYSDRTHASSDKRIYFSSTEDIGDWPSPVIVTKDSTDTWDEIMPSLAINPRTGVPGIAYANGTYLEYSIRFIKATDSTGFAFNPPVCLTGHCDILYHRCYNPSLWCEESSRWLLSWHGGKTYEISRCWFSESLDDGVEWLEKYGLNSNVIPASTSVLTSDGENVIVAWAEYRLGGSYEIMIEHGTHK